MIQVRPVLLALTLSVFWHLIPALSTSRANVNVAPFGTAWVGDTNGQRTAARGLVEESNKAAVEVKPGGVVGVEWREPRDIESVLVRGDGLAADKIVVACWAHVWPDNGN